MSNIKRAFDHGKAFIAFITCGDPDLETTAACVRAAVRFPMIEVIHPLINRAGIGIQDGSREAMEAAIRAARDHGIGIFAMKPLGGGGTDFCCLFSFLDSSDIMPASIVIFTDGQGDFPDEQAANNVPVLWLLSREEVKVPWGHCAYLK